MALRRKRVINRQRWITILTVQPALGPSITPCTKETLHSDVPGYGKLSANRSYLFSLLNWAHVSQLSYILKLQCSLQYTRGRLVCISSVVNLKISWQPTPEQLLLSNTKWSGWLLCSGQWPFTASYLKAMQHLSMPLSDDFQVEGSYRLHLLDLHNVQSDSRTEPKVHIAIHQMQHYTHVSLYEPRIDQIPQLRM